MPTFTNDQQLLETIYAGSSIANKDKRDQKIQEKNFSDKASIEFSRELDLFEEFRLKDDLIGIFGKSLISHIIRAYNKPALKFILKLHPGLVNHFFPQEQHPLHQAALLNSKEMVEILIKSGADPTKLVSKTTDSTDPRQQGLNKLFKTNSHETVESAIRANDNIHKDIKKMIIQAATKISDGRAIQTANLIVGIPTVTDYSDDSRNITFSKSSDKSSSSNSSSGSSRFLDRNSRDQRSDQNSDDEYSGDSGYHRK